MATIEQRNRRIIGGVLCLCILLLAAATVWQNRGQSGGVDLGAGLVRLGDQPAAQVNGTIIYESDVRDVAIEQGKLKKTASISRGEPLFEAILDELIDQRIMALAALERSLDQETPAKRRLAQARERILGNLLVETRLKDKVSDETAQQLFETQAALRNRGMEVRARHIQLEDIESAKNIVARLEKGESFESLALAFSTDRASRENEGDLGYFTNDMLDPEFTQMVFGAEVGAQLPIFQTTDGWHVVEVLNKRRVSVPEFEDMRAEIINQMTYNEIKTLLDELRAKADIERVAPVP